MIPDPGPDPYPLGTLLEVRVGAQKDATAVLATVQDEHARALERLSAARAEELERRETLAKERGKTEAAVSTGRLAARTVEEGARWLERLRTEIDDARQRTAACERAAAERAAAVEAAREALALAVRERQALERHREEWEAERRVAAERKAEDEIDELAARRRG